MDELGYQYLLVKCIQDGLPGGICSKLSSALQTKADPALGLARLLENSMSGSREDTFGAAEGPPAESVPGHRVVIGMDATALDKRRWPFFATSKSAGAVHMRGRALGSEDVEIDRFRRSFLKSRGMLTKTPPSIFSFRSLLEGALTAPEIKSPTIVQKMAESGMRSAPKVDPRKDCVFREKYRPSDGRLVRERHDGVVGGRMMPQSRHGKVHSAVGVAKSWKEKGNSALRVCDSGSLGGDTVGGSGPRVSYSSLLQAQLGDEVDKLHSTEVEGGFVPLLEKKTPLLSSVARRASFPAADSVSIGEQISDVHYSDKPSHASAGAELRSADEVLLRATAAPTSPELTIVEEDVSRAELVVERGDPLVADSKCTDKEVLDFRLRKMDDTAVAGDEARSADILPERSSLDLSESGEVPASALPGRTEVHVLQAEVVGDQGGFVVADPMCVDEMSDVQFLEELSRALAAGEPRFAEKVLNGDAVYSSKAAVVSAPTVATNSDDNDARALVGVDRLTPGVGDTVSTDEKISDSQLSGEPACTLCTDESRSADDALHRNILESSDAAAGVPESLVCAGIEEAGLPAGPKSASCVVASSTCSDEIGSGVQVQEELSRGIALHKSRFAEVVAEKDAIDSSKAAAVAVSHLPLPTEGDDSRVEGVVAGLMDNDEKIFEVAVSDQPSHALDGSRSVGNIFIGSSHGALDSASPVLKMTAENVSISEVVIDKEVDIFGDAAVDTGQGRTSVSSSSLSNGQVSEGRTQCPPSLCLMTVKDWIEGQTDHVHAGTSLDPAFEASHKDMDANEETVGVLEFNVCDVQAECGVGDVSETDDIVSSAVAMVSLSVEGDPLLRKVVANEHEVVSCDENLRSDELGDSETVVECSRQAALEETENGTVFDEQKDEVCDAHMSSSRGNAPLESSPVFNVSKVVLERELNDFNSNALEEKSSSTLISPSGHFTREELQPTSDHLGSRSFCSEGVSEPVNAVAVLESAWQACANATEDMNSMVGGDQKDTNCRAQFLEDFMGQDARATEEDLIGGVDGYGPQRNCVRSVETTSTSVSPDDNGGFVEVGRIDTDGRDEMVSLTENLEQDHALGRPPGSSESFKRSEEEQCKTLALADEAPEMQIVVSQSSESQTVNMGLVFCRSGHESDEFPSSWLPLAEADMQNEIEEAPESHVGEIVSGATGSGNSIDRADHILSTIHGSMSDELRQVFLRDSDARISNSLESARATGAELICGKEVQLLPVTKSKSRHARHLDDLEDNHIIHLKCLGIPITGYLDENEEQSFVSPFNGIVHEQLLGVEVRPHKKKARPRAYNHGKATREMGLSYFHLLGSKRKSQLQNAGNRCRRNRHIYPDQPVPIFVEGRDEGFEEADGGSFLRWLARQGEANAGPIPALGKRVRKNGEELVKSMIAIPSFRVLSDYEEKQHEVENGRKLRMQSQPIASSRSTLVSSTTVQPSEYDMDDEDERWLHAWNERLARNGSKQPISEDKFEEMIEYFERYAEMFVSAVGDFSGFPRCGKSFAQPLGDGFLSRECRSGLGSLSTNPAIPGTPLSGNSPTLNSPAIQPGRPLADGLESILSSRRHVAVSSPIDVDRTGRSADCPATMVRYHTLLSKNERNPSNSDRAAVCERPIKGSLRKSFEASAPEKLSNECCICNGGEDDENNPVYTCKRCLIHVHQSCYGIREKFRDDEGRVIAPLNWCCRKCEAVAVGRAQPNVSCALCRKRGGALKPTVVAQKWAHIACALYTNETFFVDPDAMEPIDGIAAVTARGQERKERCRLCGVKKGICSLCAVKDCRAPFHISCGVSQGASFEVRQSKQKVVGVRCFCPRHGRITAADSAPSAELKDRHVLNSSSTSGAAASAAASGSISTASSMDDREEWSSRQSISHPNGGFGQPAELAKNVCTDVADLTDNVMSVNGKGAENVGRARSKGIRFTLKRRWNEFCDQVSEDGLSSECQKKSSDGTGVSGGRREAPGCKPTWQVVEPGQKLKKKIEFKFGRLAQNLDLESSPMLVQREMVGSEVPQAEKMKDVMPAVGEVCGDSGADEKDAEVWKCSSEDRFAKEVKELMILEEAMRSGVAPGHIMREAFVYWRAKRAEFEGSLLCELHHEQWLKSRGIFNKEASDEERVVSGKMVSLLRVPEAQQPSSMFNEKTLEMAKEIRMQLERVRLMAQMVVQREQLKYSHQFVLGSIASARLSEAQDVSEDRHCVWCPSMKTLLKCGNCPRSFCFNCFKHRKGFGVKGWVAAMKQQPVYVCKYCRDLSNELADLSNDLDPAPKKIGGGAVRTPGNASGPAIGAVNSTLVIPSDAILKVVSTSVIPSTHVSDGRGNIVGKERGRGEGWYCPGSGSLRVAEGVVMATVSKNVDITEDRRKGLEIGSGEVNNLVGRDNARRGSPRRGPEGGEMRLCKPSHLEDGLNKFLSSARRGMEHSSFESTLRRQKILRCTNKEPQQELVTSSDELPSASIAPGPNTDGVEGLTPCTTISGNVSVPPTPGSGPALLVYTKKRRLILGESWESPSAYDFGDQPFSPRRFENGTSIRKITPPRRVENRDGAANE